MHTVGTVQPDDRGPPFPKAAMVHAWAASPLVALWLAALASAAAPASGASAAHFILSVTASGDVSVPNAMLQFDPANVSHVYRSVCGWCTPAMHGLWTYHTWLNGPTRGATGGRILDPLMF